jgi:hypothetical protein
MDETTYRTLLTQFLNDYWGAFHEVLEAQSVHPRFLAASLYDDVVAAHERFAAARNGLDPAVDRLGHLWNDVSGRRVRSVDAALSAREIEHARAQFGLIFDALLAQGKPYEKAVLEICAQAAHGTPRTPLRVDAAR